MMQESEVLPMALFVYPVLVCASSVRQHFLLDSSNQTSPLAPGSL